MDTNSISQDDNDAVVSAESTMEFANVLEALHHHVAQRPDQIAFTWVDKKCHEQKKVSYRELKGASDAVSALLVKQGCQRGDRVMIAYPFGLEFLAGIIGCQNIGVIACSVYPPNPGQMKTAMKKFKGFATDAGASFALSTNKFATAMAAASVVYRSGVRWLGTDNLIVSAKKMKQLEERLFRPRPEDTAFIQYTSGSTGQPKGVIISHKSLTENCKVIANIGRAGPGFVGCIWVPQYHDMGLIGGYFTSCFAGVHLVCASPFDFIARPMLWAEMVENYKVDFTCAPNFAFALLLKRLEQTKERSDWSHVKRAVFGGEPTNGGVVQRVISQLNMDPQNVWNMYGIAECGLCVTAGVATLDDAGLVSCGSAEDPSIPGKVRIVQKGRVVKDGEEGNIWVQSSRVASGYFAQQDETRESFHNVLVDKVESDLENESLWLDTGDIGKIVGGRLYVTGRVKDVIIINGKNYHATDVEHSIDFTFNDAVRPGRTAAFQIGADTIGVTVEARAALSDVQNTSLGADIADQIFSTQGLLVQSVLILRPGSNPKTTSGKLKRSEIRRRSLENAWDKSTVLSWHERESASLSRDSDKIGNETDTASQNMQQPQANAYHNVMHIYMAVLGSDFALTRTWAENGLTSLKRVELINQLQEKVQVQIPVNFEQLYQSPQELCDFLILSVGTAFPVQQVPKHPGFRGSAKKIPTLSLLQLGALQSLGIIVVVALFALALVPSYFLGKVVSDWSTTLEVGKVFVTWQWLPIALPLFMLSFTLELIIVKMMLIGKYKQGHINTMTWEYLRYWFVDRLVSLWEFLVGGFLLETKFLLVVYRLLGADIRFSVEVECFIREFDLVSVGESTTVSHQLKARRWRDDDSTGGPSLVLRPIQIGDSCAINGLVGPGASIGDGSKVAKHAAVAEGAQIPRMRVATGVPAYDGGSNTPHATSWHKACALDSIKVLWLFCEVYIFFGLFLVAEIIVQHILYEWHSFRYAPLLFWFLALPLTSFLGIVVSIGLKWLLIGKRDLKEPYGDSLYRRSTNWICDYHFRLSVFTLAPYLGVSKIWNAILYLHGLDIDLASSLNAGYDLWGPSQMDYFTVRRSFVACVTFDMEVVDKPLNHGSKTEIIDSTIGMFSSLGRGIQVIRSGVPPLSKINESVIDLSPDFGRDENTNQLLDCIVPELTQLAIIPLLFVSFLPAYELFQVTVYNTSVPLAFLGICGSILTQITVWLFLRKIMEDVTHQWFSPKVRAWVYGAYMNNTYCTQCWSFSSLMHGTPLFSIYLRFLGARVDDELWWLDARIYDCSLVHFGKRTVLDGFCCVNAHFVDNRGLTVEPVYVSGVIHPGCLIIAGAMVSGEEESGPNKLFLGSSSKDMEEGVQNPSSFQLSKPFSSSNVLSCNSLSSY